MQKTKKEVTFNMVVSTRAEWEEARSDANRFEQPQDYQNNEDLKWFRTEKNRKKFVKKFQRNGQELLENIMVERIKSKEKK